MDRFSLSIVSSGFRICFSLDRCYWHQFKLWKMRLLKFPLKGWILWTLWPLWDSLNWSCFLMSEFLLSFISLCTLCAPNFLRVHWMMNEVSWVYEDAVYSLTHLTYDTKKIIDWIPPSRKLCVCLSGSSPYCKMDFWEDLKSFCHMGSEYIYDWTMELVWSIDLVILSQGRIDPHVRLGIL